MPSFFRRTTPPSLTTGQVLRHEGGNKFRIAITRLTTYGDNHEAADNGVYLETTTTSLTVVGKELRVGDYIEFRAESIDREGGKSRGAEMYYFGRIRPQTSHE